MVVWVAWALAGALTVAEVPNPRSRGAYVADVADVLPAQTERALNQYLAELEAATGGEVAVVTARDTVDEPKAFATALFARWGVGDAAANNGLLVLLVLDRRRVEMETGYGLEAVLPDGWLGVMQAEVMVPRFKEGDYAGGLDAGVRAAGGRMHERAAEVRAGAAAPRGGGPAAVVLGVGAGSAVAAGALGVGGAAAAWAGVRWRRRRERTCPTCAVVMDLVPEADDDEHLTEGQQLEERLGSVDHQIYVCGTCGHTKAFEVTAWFSGYSRCGACGYRTRASSSRTLRVATRSHGGLVEITERCRQCADTRTYTRSTPRLPPPSSGGGRRGIGGGRSSGFGGGRSGGGGAGSSW